MTSFFVGLRKWATGVAPDTAFRATPDGAAVVTQAHGKHFAQAIHGRVFTGVSASGGIALIAPAAGGGHPTLWNPSDSGRYLSIVRLELSYVSGNNAPTAIEWAYTLNTGAAVATAAPILTFVEVNPIGLVGGSVALGVDRKGHWSPTTNTFTAAPTYYRPTGLSLFTGVAATAAPPFALRADYDGDLVLLPGTALSLCTQAATTTALFQVAVTWEEMDL